MRGYLTGRGSYVFHPRCRAVRLEEHAIVDVAGARWEADLVIVGDRGRRSISSMGPGGWRPHLQRVRLQMMETLPVRRRADDVGG